MNYSHPKKLPRFLTEPQMIALLNLVKAPRDKAMVEVLYSTGMRVNELIHIRNGDINLENKTIKITHGKASRWNGRKERLSILNQHAITAIRNYKALDNSEESFMGLEKTGEVRDILNKYGDQLGFKIRPHMIRHSIATHMLNRGMNVRYIQEFLGHANISTTAIYTHLDIETLKREHQKLFTKRPIEELLMNIIPSLKVKKPQDNIMERLNKIQNKQIELNQQDPLLSTNEVCDILGLCSQTIWNYVKWELLKNESPKGMFFTFRTSHIKTLLENPPIWLQRAWKVKQSHREGHTKEMILKAWRIFKDEDKLPRPNANCPIAERHKYLSIQKMADRLGISYATYNTKIRSQINKMFEAEKKIKKELINRFIEKELSSIMNENKKLIDTTYER